MARHSVEVNGEWACFSSIVEDFLTPFMSLTEYELWQKRECSQSKASGRSMTPLPLREALFKLCLNKTDTEIMDSLRTCGLLPWPKN